MMRKFVSSVLSATLALALLAGCGAAPASQAAASSSGATSEAASSTPVASSATTETSAALPDGVYSADFETDSSMFSVNEACNGKGTLTVKDGTMTLHISLKSQKSLNLFPGMAADAEKDGAVWLEPTVDTVTYSDGTTEEVYGFDVPVPEIGQEFDLALVGTKGTWYDHKVSVQNPEPQTASENAAESTAPALTDGSYTCAVKLEGGSGRATVESPAALRVENGEIFATIVWGSPNYDYMKVAEQKFELLSTEGNSTFEIPVSGFDQPLTVVADTIAMSTPHEVTYTLTFDSASIQKAEG